MITARLRRSSGAAIMLLRTKRSSTAKVAAGSFVSLLRSPTFLVGEHDHVLQPLLVAPGERAQPASEVVVQHERPAAEELLRQKLRQHVVVRRVVSAGSEEVVGVAVKHERGGGAGKIQLGQLSRPRRIPVGELGGTLRSRRYASCRSTCRRSVSRIAGGSSSWSARPVRCCSSLTAFSVWRMLSAAEST